MAEQPPSSRALVTGADGLLGANLVRQLLDSGVAVRALVLPTSPARALAGLDVDLVGCDLRHADDRLLDSLARNCDVVFHAAAITDLQAPPALVWDVNVRATERLAAAAQRAGVGRFVLVGSASAYQFGPADAPGNERAPFPAAHRGLAYMESKAAASTHVLDLAARGDLDAVVVAPTFMIGPHDARPSSGELLRQFLTRGLRYVAPGGRNFAVVGDVAAALVAAWRRGRTGAAYLAGGHNLDYLSFFTMVAEVAGVAPPRGVVPPLALRAVGAAGSAAGRLRGRALKLDRTVARLACLEAYYDSSTAIAELGMPQSPLEPAIAAAIAGLEQYGHLPARAA